MAKMSIKKNEQPSILFRVLQKLQGPAKLLSTGPWCTSHSAKIYIHFWGWLHKESNFRVVEVFSMYFEFSVEPCLLFITVLNVKITLRNDRLTVSAELSLAL